MSSKRKKQPSLSSAASLKKGSPLAVGLAVLILVVGWLMSQRGTPLPAEITHLAEEVVKESLSDNNAADTPPAVTPPRAAAPVPAPDGGEIEAETQPWANATGEFDYYVLALSWQPAFCESRPDKTECASQSAGRYDAANFALHGLWPNRRDDPQHTFGYCNLAPAVIEQDHGDWCDMPPLDLSEPVWRELTTLMPGTASCLQNHEWYKHGTCAGLSADAYFALANRLTTLFAGSDFNRYVAARSGQSVTRQELLAQFEAEFGSEADDYLSLRCSKDGGDSLLSEIQLALKADLSDATDFAQLFPAEKIPPQGNCPQQFKIDAVGSGNS